MELESSLCTEGFIQNKNSQVPKLLQNFCERKIASFEDGKELDDSLTQKYQGDSVVNYLDFFRTG